MGFPQIYVQALVGVVLALSGTGTEVNKSKLKPWAVSKSDAQVAGSQEQWFYSEEEMKWRNPPIQQCINCPDTDETSSRGRRTPSPCWQIPEALTHCDCLSISSANQQFPKMQRHPHGTMNTSVPPCAGVLWRQGFRGAQHLLYGHTALCAEGPLKL